MCVVMLIFGFLYGFGFVFKIIEYNIVFDGFLVNFILFNVGVEFG